MAAACAPQKAERFSPALQFVARFALIAGALFAIYSFPYREWGISELGFQYYLAAYAQICGVFIRWIDANVVVEESRIFGQFAIEIAKNCDAVEINILFASAWLAFAANSMRKYLVLVLGLIGLNLLNIFRICSLYWLGMYWPSYFEFAHLELWPLLLVACCVLQFVLAANGLQATAGKRTASLVSNRDPALVSSLAREAPCEPAAEPALGSLPGAGI